MRAKASTSSTRAGVATFLFAAALICLEGTGIRAAAQEARQERALDLTNEARQDNGLAPLTSDRQLDAAAQAHAEDMLARDYYAHESPEGDTVRDRFLAEGGGKWRLVAENIAMCSGCPTPPELDQVESFHEGWMESPEHRENILDPGLEEFGFGMAVGENEVYAVQTFAGPGRPEGLKAGEAEERLTPEALRETALEALNQARQEADLSPLQPSQALSAAARRLTRNGAIQAPEDGLIEMVDQGDVRPWLSIGLVSGECGGCGTVLTAADVEGFVSDWLEQERLAERLLDPEAEVFGFAMSANGTGRKGALALVGRRR